VDILAELHSSCVDQPVVLWFRSGDFDRMRRTARRVAVISEALTAWPAHKAHPGRLLTAKHRDGRGWVDGSLVSQ
jgi:hypothetical protein